MQFYNGCVPQPRHNDQIHLEKPGLHQPSRVSDLQCEKSRTASVLYKPFAAQLFRYTSVPSSNKQPSSSSSSSAGRHTSTGRPTLGWSLLFVTLSPSEFPKNVHLILLLRENICRNQNRNMLSKKMGGCLVFSVPLRGF